MCLLLTFIVILLCKGNYDLKYKHGNFSLLLKVAFKILYNMFCLSFFFYTISTFTFLQFEGGSDKNTLELSYEVFWYFDLVNHLAEAWQLTQASSRVSTRSNSFQTWRIEQQCAGKDA